MSNILINIKELVSFYIKINYEEYLKENKLKKIEEDKIEHIVNEMFKQRRDHMIEFVKTALKDVLKEEYPSDFKIDSIFRELLEDEKICINKVILEIKIYQKENLEN